MIPAPLILSRRSWIEQELEKQEEIYHSLRADNVELLRRKSEVTLPVREHIPQSSPDLNASFSDSADHPPPFL